ncbi:STAS domain-containing protein [Actinomadura parmotrematis]|uniref:Anti-sigma factor antagonist n=1 Tax=Actinomadura parmotrematis TaxID=2864039 RepID=A0ABS7FKC9_9ACTN|nr:STAS domain-containing protein [Actinomadura parmotrematis]MBW8480813.1 STAS domain-containing protein [Actinomadura parmotrematis]
METLHLSARRTADTAVLSVAGELDMATAPHLLARVDGTLADGRLPRVLVLDVGATVFIDAAGLGALLAAQRAARRLDVPLRLSGASEAVDRLLSITRTRHCFTYAEADGDAPGAQPDRRSETA